MGLLMEHFLEGISLSSNLLLKQPDLLKISRMILSYPLADCIECRACLAHMLGRQMSVQPKHIQISPPCQGILRRSATLVNYLILCPT